jgi:hypothetical protein
MQPNDAGSVSAVPSGSAGEPTPTDGARRAQGDAATTYPTSEAENGPIGARGAQANSAASRLAALRQHPEVQSTLLEHGFAVLAFGNAEEGPAKDFAWREWRAKRDALLVAVAAAANDLAARVAAMPSPSSVRDGGYDRDPAEYAQVGLMCVRKADLVRALAGGAPQGVSDERE